MRCIHNIDLDYWCYQCEADCMNPWDNMIEEAYRHNEAKMLCEHNNPIENGCIYCDAYSDSLYFEAIRKLDLPDGWDCDCPICTGQDDDYSRD